MRSQENASAVRLIRRSVRSVVWGGLGTERERREAEKSLAANHRSTQHKSERLKLLVSPGGRALKDRCVFHGLLVLVVAEPDSRSLADAKFLDLKLFLAASGIATGKGKSVRHNPIKSPISTIWPIPVCIGGSRKSTCHSPSRDDRSLPRSALFRFLPEEVSTAAQ